MVADTSYRETPILKAKRIGIGKLNNAAKRKVWAPKACFGEHTCYNDSLIAITGDSILFKRYNLFERDRLVLFSDIEKISVKPASIWNGKFRFHGTGDFHTWFPRDFQRYKRDKIFFAFIRNKWWRIGFTVEDSAAVIKIFQEKGLIRDIV